VEDDVVDCVVVQDEKCEDETIGYTTQKKCQKWPRYSVLQNIIRYNNVDSMRNGVENIALIYVVYLSKIKYLVSGIRQKNCGKQGMKFKDACFSKSSRATKCSVVLY
jgi:hypothetical protein